MKQELSHTQPDPSFSLHLIGLSIVLSCAITIRFLNLSESIPLSPDIGRTLLAGRNILLGQTIISGPPTSVAGLSLGPLYYYLTAFALKLSNFQPIGPAFMNAGFGAAVAGLLYYFTSKHWGREVGLFSGLFFALSPHAAAQSRLPIEPSPLPFFTVLWLISTTNWLISKKNKWLLGSIISIFIAIQLNFSAIIFLPSLILNKIGTLKKFSRDRKIFIIFCSLFVISTLSLTKVLFFNHTRFEYLARIWTTLTTPDNQLAAFVFFILTTIYCLSLIKNLLIPTQIIVITTTTAFLAFTIKTVNGDHSLALLFPIAAFLLGSAIYNLQKNIKIEQSALLSLFFLLISLNSYKFISLSTAPYLTDYLSITNQIIEASQNKPYTLIYRGHLDIYDAADDHLQYLLWLKGYEPTDSYRIEINKNYQEKWLTRQNEKSEQTITLTFPPQTTKNLQFSIEKK